MNLLVTCIMFVKQAFIFLTASSCAREGLGWTLLLRKSVGHWHRLPREVVESLPLEGFHNREDVASYRHCLVI